MRFFIVFVLALSLNAGNLKDLLDSIKNNEALKARDYITNSALEKSDEVFYRYLPNVSLEANYMDFAKDRLVILPKHSMSASLVIKALLYDGERQSNIKLANKNYELNKLLLDKSKNEMQLELTKLYYAYLTLNENIEYKNKNIEYLNASLNRLEQLASVGLKPYDELQIFKAKVELEKIELEQFLHNKNEILSGIYMLTNSKKVPEKGSKINLKIHEINSIDVDINNIKASMSELKKDAKYAEFLPKIYIQNMTVLSKSKYDFSEFGVFSPIIHDKVKEKMTSNIFILGFKWDIFSFGASKKALEQAKLESLAAKQMLNYEKRKNKENIRLIKQEIDILNKEIKANENRVNASKIAFLSIAKKYDAGLLSYVEYLNALELNYGALAALSLAKNKLEISKAKLLLEQGYKIGDNIED